MVHGWLGLVSEMSELGQAIVKGDDQNISEEVGDVFWYTALLTEASDSTPINKIAQANIAKLQSRYPEKFSPQRALVRNLTEEFQVLSNSLQ
jgi:NTP pyrophosphatase (non-canonical NTP hydrolase)